MNLKVQAPFLTSPDTTKLTLASGQKVVVPPFPPLRISGPKVQVANSDASANDPGELIEVKVDAATAEKLASPAVALVQSATETLTETATKVHTIRTDRDLSTDGRQRRVAPVLAQGIEEIAMIWTACEENIARVAEAEAKLLAVPALAPSATAVALVEIEMRQWFRAQLPDTRAATLTRITAPTASDDDRALLIALLHNPVGVSDPETKILRDRWEANARNAQPDTAVRIEVERESLEWAQHCIAVLAASMVNVVGGDRVDILRTLLRSNERAQRGFRAYGFNADDVARMRRIIDAERKAAA